MDFGKIGVLMGGPSAEREISFCSGKAISDALKQSGYNVIDIGEEGLIEDQIVKNDIDIAFIALHGRYGEDGTIQRFLEDRQILYTGSDSRSSAKALDKIISKEIFVSNNIPTEDYFVCENPVNINDVLNLIKKRFLFPVVVKPSLEGSSIGLSVVLEETDFEKALEAAFQCCSRVVVEKYIAGKEITVGILGNEPLPVVEIVPKTGFYDFHAKYTGGITEYIVPAQLEENVYKKVQQIAIAAHTVLGCRDLSRVDMRVDTEGEPWVLEVNTIPGFTPTSLLPKAAKAVGITFKDLCRKILEMADMRREIKCK